MDGIQHADSSKSVAARWPLKEAGGCSGIRTFLMPPADSENGKAEGIGAQGVDI